MTIWKPDTCKCVADVEKKTLLEKCTKHDTYAQMKAANRAENIRFGNSPTQTQVNTIQDKKQELYKSSRLS